MSEEKEDTTVERTTSEQVKSENSDEKSTVVAPMNSESEPREKSDERKREERHESSRRRRSDKDKSSRRKDGDRSDRSSRHHSSRRRRDRSGSRSRRRSRESRSRRHRHKSSRSPSRSRSRRRRRSISPPYGGSLSRSRSRSSSRPLSPPVNRHRSEDLKSFWDWTPEMCDEKEITVNNWQPSQENPYFSSATAALQQATAAALTNPHNLKLHENPVNEKNVIVTQQKLHNILPAVGGASLSVHSSSAVAAAVNPLLAAIAAGTKPSSTVSTGISASSTSAFGPSASQSGSFGSSSHKNVVVPGRPTAAALAGLTNPGSSSLSSVATPSSMASAPNLAAILQKFGAGDPKRGPSTTGPGGNYMHESRAARRVYVGNLPQTVTEGEIRQFFNAIMVAAQGDNRSPGESVINVYINPQKRFSFVEMRSEEEATQALQLEGIQFRGESLKIGRPANYNPSMSKSGGTTAPKLNTAALGIISNYVPNGPNKLYCGGIPYSLTEEQVKELLQSHGKLAAFFLAKDTITNNSKGYCFFEYADASVTEKAIANLNGLRIGDRQLAVRRHTPAAGASAHNPAMNLASSLGNMNNMASFMQSMQMTGNPPSNVVCLSNMVTEDILKDETEYQQLISDVREECANYGTIVAVYAPRPGPGGAPTPGLGRVFVKYVSVAGAQKARESLDNRTFDDQRVSAKFYRDDDFAQGRYDR